MAELKLDNEYDVYADGTSWTLRRTAVNTEVRNNKGEHPKAITYAYHAKLKYALAQYLDECLKPSTSVQDVLTAITDAENRIFSAVGVK